MAHPRAQQARELWRHAEPVHAVTYFSAEPLSALRSAGYKGFWMGYFAGRAAPLGPASPELVRALFHNFSADHVARSLPDAWAFAPPAAALAARVDGSVAALLRMLGERLDERAVGRAAELALRAAESAPVEGRALFAANRALPAPTEPLARLWHAATLLREHRGDGHVAALTAAGIGGREAHVLHALSSGTPASVYAAARHLDAEEWSALIDGLARRGLADPAAGLTEAGRELKERVEQQTDDLAASALAVLADEEVAELIALLRPVSAAVVASGDIPRKSPMGLDLGPRPAL
jgi:DNA-binding MarR family transcriptional regulator